MPKFVMLGSCRHEPYEMLFMPNKIDPTLYREEHEKAYDEACKTTYPAIEKADVVIVYVPDGIIGDHTQRDLTHAISHKKKIVVITHRGKKQ